MQLAGEHLHRMEVEITIYNSSNLRLKKLPQTHKQNSHIIH